MTTAKTSLDDLTKIFGFHTGVIHQNVNVSAATNASHLQGVAHGLSLSSARLSNFRCDRYGVVYRTIQQMAKLPVGHHLSIDPALAERAALVIRILENNSDAGAPRIYPEDDDTLVLKWVDDRVERLMALVGDEIEVSTEDLASESIKTVDFGKDWAASLADVLKELNAGFASSSESASGKHA